MAPGGDDRDAPGRGARAPMGRPGHQRFAPFSAAHDHLGRLRDLLLVTEGHKARVIDLDPRTIELLQRTSAASRPTGPSGARTTRTRTGVRPRERRPRSTPTRSATRSNGSSPTPACHGSGCTTCATPTRDRARRRGADQGGQRTARPRVAGVHAEAVRPRAARHAGRSGTARSPTWSPTRAPTPPDQEARRQDTGPGPEVRYRRVQRRSDLTTSSVCHPAKSTCLTRCVCGTDAEPLFDAPAPRGHTIRGRTQGPDNS